MVQVVVPMCQRGTRRAKRLVRPGDFLLLRRSVRDEKIFPARFTLGGFGWDEEDGPSTMTPAHMQIVVRVRRPGVECQPEGHRGGSGEGHAVVGVQ